MDKQNSKKKKPELRINYMICSWTNNTTWCTSFMYVGTYKYSLSLHGTRKEISGLHTYNLEDTISKLLFTDRMNQKKKPTYNLIITRCFPRKTKNTNYT